MLGRCFKAAIRTFSASKLRPNELSTLPKLPSAVKWREKEESIYINIYALLYVVCNKKISIR